MSQMEVALLMPKLIEILFSFQRLILINVIIILFIRERIKSLEMILLYKDHWLLASGDSIFEGEKSLIKRLKAKIEIA